MPKSSTLTMTSSTVLMMVGPPGEPRASTGLPSFSTIVGVMEDRGLIAGETTFGKGLVQTVYPLSENTGLALTTAKYYTPSGRLIQRDYSNISLYDYYYNDRNNDANNANHEVKMTDSGRTVYGGGGITPDPLLPAGQ